MTINAEIIIDKMSYAKPNIKANISSLQGIKNVDL